MTGRPARPALPPRLRGPLGLVSVLAALAVLALGVLYADAGRPGTVDARLVAALDGAPPGRQVAVATDFLGEPVGAALLVAALVTGCLLLRRPRAAVLVVVGPGLAVAATKVLKHLVGRTIHGDGNLSYPSGHTAFLTAVALAVALLVAGRPALGRTAGTAIVLAAALAAGAAMGWAQVVLSAHYPTDTLGGLCTALAVVPAAARLLDRAADAAGRARG
ncbi:MULTISPECIES: phosphatase PAP2 family protein [Streptomyces]|uniref:phosphatase PAP2 family protein n=1 Tax=Streptomyces TaxID=1883 RepID=UPI0002E34AB7|nr:phosphatase PAP2 family protein [Streptomyces venezuelae]APE26655.1 hypothetical protein vnz_35380 [Streptomyces venezuelae]QES04074.1 phosphatase PAP2 family protein [Streptomyces venezuelae ATCC 10712]